MITGDARPVRASVTIKQAGDYWVLVPQEPRDVVVVNSTGHHVFAQCDGSHSCEGIARQIAAETGGDVETVLRDVVAFIRRLEDVGLLRTGWQAD